MDPNSNTDITHARPNCYMSTFLISVTGHIFACIDVFTLTVIAYLLRSLSFLISGSPFFVH